MRGKLSDKQRLEHITDAIEEIEAFTGNISAEAYSQNRMMQLACVKCLEIIGEAAGHISEETKTEYHAIEWQKIKAFRNFAVHEYFNVSSQLVWKIIENDLSALKAAIQEILNNFEE